MNTTKHTILSLVLTLCFVFFHTTASAIVSDDDLRMYVRNYLWTALPQPSCFSYFLNPSLDFEAVVNALAEEQLLILKASLSVFDSPGNAPETTLCYIVDLAFHDLYASCSLKDLALKIAFAVNITGISYKNITSWIKVIGWATDIDKIYRSKTMLQELVVVPYLKKSDSSWESYIKTTSRYGCTSRGFSNHCYNWGVESSCDCINTWDY